MSQLVHYARRIHQEVVRDIYTWPDWKIRFSGLLNPSTIQSILTERREWLKTSDGKRMVELVAELRSLL